MSGNMEWLKDLFLNDSIAHTILVLAAAITVGLLLKRIKIGNISLGNTWILFAGIAMSHFGFTINTEMAEFVKNFGLVLFVYCIGLQVGPSFFSSFRKGGVKLILVAVAAILLGSGLTLLLAGLSGEKVEVMTGVLSGSVTSTPALGAAQQIMSEVEPSVVPTMAMGYAIAYPVGVICLILTIMLFKNIFKVDTEKEEQRIIEASSADDAGLLNVKVTEPGRFGRSCEDAGHAAGCHFVITRIMQTSGKVVPVQPESVLNQGDILRIVCAASDKARLVEFFGEQVHIDAKIWETEVQQLVTKRVLVSKSEINGRSLRSLDFRHLYDVNVTRVTRMSKDMVPSAGFILQVGDRVTVVGREEACQKVADILGNSMKKLDVPHIIPIFAGIFLGVILGSIPILIPNMPYPVKLGLAGGPLIVAILLGRYGPSHKMVTFTTSSANLMLREVGISLFLACVGLLSGAKFVETLLGGGYVWLLWAFILTVVPAAVASVVMYKWMKLDFFTTMGCVAGIYTNPMALSQVNAMSNIEHGSVAYTTVYPIATFLRILLAEVLVMAAM